MSVEQGSHRIRISPGLGLSHLQLLYSRCVLFRELQHTVTFASWAYPVSTVKLYGKDSNSVLKEM